MNFNKKFISYFFSIFIVLLAIIASATYLVENYSNEHEIDILLNNEKSNLFLLKRDLVSVFDNIISDLEVYQNSSKFIKYVNSKLDEDLLAVEQNWLSFSATKRIYDHVRFVDVNGNEIIRIIKKNGIDKLLPKEQLHNKSGRYYFTETMNLNKGEVFVSPLDLNLENGIIEQPVKPTLRIATPVFDSLDNKQGIVILNVLAKYFLDQIISPSGDSTIQAMLVNKDGFFLKARNSEDEFGFMYGDFEKATFENKFPGSWSSIFNNDNGQLENDLGIFTYETVYPISEAWQSSSSSKLSNAASFYEINTRNYLWKLVSHIPQETVSHYVTIKGIHTYFSPFIFSIVSLILAFLGALLLTKRKTDEDKKMEMYNELKSSEQKFRNLLNYTNSWEYLITENGNVEYCSPATKTITGYEPKEFIRNKELLSSIIHEEDRKNFTTHFLKNFSDPKIHKSEFRIKTKNGEEKFIEHTCQPIFNDDGKFLGRRSSNRDITENKINQEIILESEKQLINELETKDKFFSIVSHDLKSPLYGLITLSQMLRDERKDFSEKDLDESLDGMHEALEGMSHLVEELLEWSRIQTDRIEFEPETFEIKQIVDHVLSLLKLNINEKNLNVNTIIDFNHQVFADRNMVQTILRNLISNAIKFTGNGGSLTISSVTRGDFEEITVADSGVGIDEKHLEKLFRIDVSHTTLGTKKERGSGVGLVLCKELVEKQNGKIWVESKLNVGSQFTFSLPITKKNIVESKPTESKMKNEQLVNNKKEI